MARSDRPSLASVLAQADHFIDPATGAVVPPIQPATTFARGADYELPDRYIYGRYDSPTVAQLEAVLAELDGASEALVFGSGMAAFAALIEIVASGQRIVAPRIMYHGGLSWLRRVAEKRGITLDLFDPADPDALERAVTADRTALLWIESPVNPTWGRDRHCRRRGSRACPWRAGRGRRDRGAAGHHAGARSRRRHRVPFGDQIPQWPQRRGRRRARGERHISDLGRDQGGARPARRGNGGVRGLADAARPAHPRCEI